MICGSLKNENEFANFGMYLSESTMSLVKFLEGLDEPIEELSTTPKSLMTTLRCSHTELKPDKAYIKHLSGLIMLLTALRTFEAALAFEATLKIRRPESGKEFDGAADRLFRDSGSPAKGL